jgi:hypothetical protein
MRTLLIVIVLAVPAFGGTLDNKDSREYRLLLKAAGAETTVPINTRTRVDRTCVAFPCVIENKDTGEKVKLTTADEHVVIQNGRLTVSLRR